MLDSVWARLLPASPQSRKDYGVRAAVVGIGVNLLLFAAKLAVGLLSGAVSIVADAVNNLSDLGTSAVVLLGFRVAAKPADGEHPYGHGRAEYLAGLFVAAAILFVGFELLYESAQKILHPEEMAADGTALAVLALSILAKFLLASFYRSMDRRIRSTALRAAAADSRMDCAATGIVLLAMLAYMGFGIDVDGVAGVLVALFVLSGGWETMKDALQPLLGDAPSPELVTGIRRMALDAPGVLGVHGLMVHNYGPEQGFISMHLELPETMDLVSAHALADRLERQIQARFRMPATLHVDPVGKEDTR